MLSYSSFLCVLQCRLFCFFFCFFCCTLVFLLFCCFPLIFDVLSSVLVCDPDLFSQNRFMTLQQRYTTVAFIYQIPENSQGPPSLRECLYWWVLLTLGCRPLVWHLYFMGPTFGWLVLYDNGPIVTILDFWSKALSCRHFVLEKKNVNIIHWCLMILK